jgi:hypothetical protein
MELQKVSKRLEKLRDNLEKAYTKDIKQIIENIFKEYTILHKGTCDTVSEELFLNKFLFNMKEQVPICLGISQNGNKCCRKSQPYSNYCKTHFYLEFKKRNDTVNDTVNDNDNDIVIYKCNNQNLENKENLEKIFIEDAFYYKDHQFIYDTEDYEKVGYIDTEGVSILTDDPFILG